MTELGSTQFKTEGSPAFPVADTGNENPASPSEGKETNGDQTQSQGGEQIPADAGDGTKDGTEVKDAGLLEHPRWKERENDWKGRFNDQEQRHTQELGKLREEFDAKLKGIVPPKVDDDIEGMTSEIPSWFGGDEKQWAEFQKWNEGLVAKASEKQIGEIKAKTEAEQKAIDDATTYLNDQVASIESDKALNPKGEKIDRNKLLKIVLDNELVDTKGRWNYKAGYLLMKGSPATQAKAADTTDRKNLAASTTTEKSAETKAPDYATSEDFQKQGARPW